GRRQLRLGGGRRLGQSRRAHRPAPAEVAHRARRLGSGGSADRRREAAQGPGYAGGLMARFGLSSLQTAPPPPQPEAAEPAPAPAPAPKPATASPAAPPMVRDPEAEMLDLKVKLHGRLIDELDLSKLDKLEDGELRRQVMNLVMDFARGERLVLSSAELESLGASVYDEMVGLGPIEPLLKDDSINDILINGPYQVYVERRGELELTPVRFRDNDHLLRIVNRIVAGVGRRIDESSPMVDARLADGSRVNAAIAPITIDGAAVSIRKFSKKPYTLEKLVEVGAMPAPVAEFLYGAVRARVSTVIS